MTDLQNKNCTNDNFVEKKRFELLKVIHDISALTTILLINLSSGHNYSSAVTCFILHRMNWFVLYDIRMFENKIIGKYYKNIYNINSSRLNEDTGQRVCFCDVVFSLIDYDTQSDEKKKFLENTHNTMMKCSNRHEKHKTAKYLQWNFLAAKENVVWYSTIISYSYGTMSKENAAFPTFPIEYFMWEKMCVRSFACDHIIWPLDSKTVWNSNGWKIKTKQRLRIKRILI